MAQRKILSERFLNFIGKRGRSVASGGRGVIELHHESLFFGFKGGRKKYNDLGAMPLTKEEHTDRHTYGMAWWDKIGKNPVEIQIGLLQDYRDTLSPFSFKSEVEYQDELELVESHIAELEERLENESV